MQIHPVVNVSRVKPYHDRLEGQVSNWPEPVHVTEDRDNEWEVDQIIDSRYKNKKLEFLVHWKGYDDTDRTWEPKSDLGNCYGRSLAPNITDLVDFSFVSYLISCLD